MWVPGWLVSRRTQASWIRDRGLKLRRLRKGTFWGVERASVCVSVSVCKLSEAHHGEAEARSGAVWTENAATCC